MTSVFDSLVIEASRLYLNEQDAAAVQQQTAAPAPQQGQAAQPDPAMPGGADTGGADTGGADTAGATQDPGFDVYKDITSQLLRTISTFASAIQSNDQEQMTAVQRTIPEDFSQQVQQAISQIATAPPATTAQVISMLLSSVNSTSGA